MTGKNQKTYAWNSLLQNPRISAEETEDQHDKTVTKSQKIDVTWLSASGKLQSKKRDVLQKRKVQEKPQKFPIIGKSINQGYQDNFERMSVSSILQGNTAALCSSQMCCETSAKRGNSINCSVILVLLQHFAVT